MINLFQWLSVNIQRYNHNTLSAAWSLLESSSLALNYKQYFKKKIISNDHIDHVNHEEKKERRKIIKNSKDISTIKPSWKGLLGKWGTEEIGLPSLGGIRCLGIRTRTAAEVRISSSKTLTRMITANLFQPEIFSKADSEMFHYTQALPIRHVVTILRLNHSKVVPAWDLLEDWPKIVRSYIRSANITRGNYTSALPIRSRLHYSGYHSATHSRMTCADCHSEPAVAALCPVSDVIALLCWYPLQASDWVLSSWDWYLHRSLLEMNGRLPWGYRLGSG